MEFGVVDVEIGSGKAVKASEHVGKNGPVESGIFLGSEGAQAVEAMSGGEGGQVAGGGSAKECQRFVGGEFVFGEDWSILSVFQGESPGIPREVDPRSFDVGGHQEASEPVGDLKFVAL